jgi:hypothetical protein
MLPEFKKFDAEIGVQISELFKNPDTLLVEKLSHR